MVFSLGRCAITLSGKFITQLSPQIWKTQIRAPTCMVVFSWVVCCQPCVSLPSSQKNKLGLGDVWKWLRSVQKDSTLSQLLTRGPVS